jgi:hypothetical protein
MADTEYSQVGTEVEAADIAATDVVLLGTSGPATKRTIISKLVAAIKRFLGATVTITSSATIGIDLLMAGIGRCSIADNTTLSTSNRADGRSCEFFLKNASGSSKTIAYPSWVNVGGTELPTSIADGVTYHYRLHCFGSAETDVCAEFVNGAGVIVSLTASPAVQCPKASSVGFNPASNVSGGPNRGWIVVTLTASAGTFTMGVGFGKISETLDPDGSGRYTALQFLTVKHGNSLGSHLTGMTWYPTTISGVPQVCTGTITLVVSDYHDQPSFYIGVTGYGADEVQQLQWTNTGTPTAPTGGKFTLSHSGYGTTGVINVTGGTSAIQAALTALMGSQAPTVGGDMTTTTFTFSNGTLAHVDTAEMTVGGDTPVPHDSTGNAGFSFTQTQTGDGVSQPDIHSGAWGASDVGEVNFGGTIYTRGGSTTVVIGAVTYTLADFGTSFTLTASDNDPHGAVSATPDLGFALTGTMSTTTQGNT